MNLPLLSVWVDGKAAELNIYDAARQTVTVPSGLSVSRIRLDFALPIGDHALILGDAWERGYGDLMWEHPDRRKIYPWYISIDEDGRNTLLGVKTGCNAFCHWTLEKGKISLHVDVRCGSFPVQPEEAFIACEVVSMQAESGNLFANLQAFCRLMCKAPLLPNHPVYGGNNWYYAYGNSSAEIILQDTQRIATWAKGLENRPYMVIDACWQPFMLNDECCAGGPYPGGNYLFPDMPGLAAQMKEMGVKPGLWYRPLKTAQSLPYHYFIDKMILDPTVPKVYDMLRADAEQLSGWGYQLLKHDFSSYDFFGHWGFEMMEDGIRYKKEYAFHDRTKTTAMAVKLLYQAILEGAKVHGALIIGCNTISHLAAGLTHIQRTGDDTSGLEWARTRKMGVNTMAFRLPQHGTFYAADGDCIGITDKISWTRNKQWLELLAKSGTPLFVSADPKALTPETETAIAEAFALAAIPRQPMIPLDWQQTPTPETWQTQTETLSFDWR